jgi:signal transduction histidine kinase
MAAAEKLMRGRARPPDFGPLLAAVTPEGAASYLIRLEDEEAVVVAAYGLAASSLIGTRRAPAAGSAPNDPAGRSLVSFSASGRCVGTPVPPEQITGLEPGMKAGLRIELVDRTGAALGWLDLLDPSGERILEPEAVNLARMAAWQISLTLENSNLSERLESESAEVQRLGRQLTEASKLGAVGELAAAVAHEVNNPLTGILGFSELLLSELPRDDPRREDVRVIMAEAVRARSIVRALVDFARPRPPQRVPSDLNELTRGALGLVRGRAREAGVWIVEEYQELPFLDLDPDAFKQALLNLFDNAMEAMPHGGQLSVATRRQGDRVAVTVADNGVGMDAETRKRVFTPFFSTRGANRGGTGLGLSVGLRIIAGHSGTIELDSQPGKGSAFTIWLPISQPDLNGPVPVPPAGPGLKRAIERTGRPHRSRRRAATGRTAAHSLESGSVGTRGRGEAA